MLKRGRFPILDHDDDPGDVIGAMAPPPATRLPERAVLGILGPKVGQYAAANRLEQIGTMDMVTVSYPIYKARRGSQQIAVVEAPVGAPAAVMVAEYLASAGVRVAIAVGSCGALQPFGEGEFLIPVRALRDEGTSYHYLPASEWVGTDMGVRRAAARVLASHGLVGREVNVWTTDAFHRETRELVADRVGRGCAAVEMECAAWAAWAKFRGVRFGQLLFTADSLTQGHYEFRNFGRDHHQAALELAVEIAFEA